MTPPPPALGASHPPRFTPPFQRPTNVRSLVVGAITALALIAVVARPVLSIIGPAAPGLPATARVSRVVDGDTLVASWGGRSQRIRVIGANTPELHVMTGGPIECYGDVARDFVTGALTGAKVRLTGEAEAQDRYGRTLADVHVLGGPLAGRDLAHELVERGYARILPFPPNIWHADDLATAQRDAIAAQRGLWKTCAGRR